MVRPNVAYQSPADGTGKRIDWSTPTLANAASRSAQRPGSTKTNSSTIPSSTSRWAASVSPRSRAATIGGKRSAKPRSAKIRAAEG